MRWSKAAMMMAISILMLFCVGGDAFGELDPLHTFWVRQSDGYEFQVRDDNPDCIPVFETMDGYAIVQNREDGDWYYVVQNPEGYLVATPYKVGQYEPASLGLKKHGQSTAEEMGITSSGTGLPLSSARSTGTQEGAYPIRQTEGGSRSL